MFLSPSLATAAYIGATILFIMSLGGLSHPVTSRRGNAYGMIGMALAVLATVFGPRVTPAGYAWIIGAIAVGATIGLYAARVVKMTQMPELVALMHSLVGLAAVFVGFANYIDPAAGAAFEGAERTIHHIEIYLGVLIGAVTFSGSLVAFGKLAGRISGKPVTLPGRHAFNLLLLGVVIWYGVQFAGAPGIAQGMLPLYVMTGVALLFGVHMVMAIGGADMPVVVSMLNSYSGWAAAATGFMLSNDLLIVTGALVGSSGAILSYSDPHVPNLPKMRHYHLPPMSSTELTAGFLASQDCVLISTDHTAFDYQHIVEHSAMVLDTRNATKNVLTGREKIFKA